MSKSPTPRPVKIAVGLAVASVVGSVALLVSLFNNLSKAPEVVFAPVKAMSPEDMACSAAFAGTVYSVSFSSKPAAERAAIEAMHNTPAEGNLLLKGCAAAWNKDVTRLEAQADKPDSFACAENRDILMRLAQIKRAGVDDAAGFDALNSRALGVMNNHCAGVPIPRR